MELERIKGIRIGKGGDKTSKQDNLNCSQKDLAEDLRISQQQLQDYKNLFDGNNFRDQSRFYRF